MSASPVFVATFADEVCTRMSIYCPDDLDLERGKRLARYAYESRTGKPAVSFTKAHFEDTNGKVLMAYSAIELDDDADEPATLPPQVRGEQFGLPPQTRGEDGFKVSPREPGWDPVQGRMRDEPAPSSKKRRSKSKDG
jgi:hypothetical protein